MCGVSALCLPLVSGSCSFFHVPFTAVADLIHGCISFFPVYPVVHSPPAPRAWQVYVATVPFAATLSLFVKSFFQKQESVHCPLQRRTLGAFTSHLPPLVC